MKTLVLSAIALAALVLSSGPAAAQEADTEFFRGRTVTYIVSTGAGGGYDTYGRLLSRYMEKYLPGSRFVVRNVPGAGHIIGANTIYVARPDGLTLGTFVTGLIYTQLLEQQGVRFDLSKMTWIGKMADEGRSLVLSANSGIETAEELIASPKTVLLSSSGIGASNHIESRILIYALGLNADIVPNMQQPETEMSMIRGEVTGILSSESSISDFVQAGNGKFVMTVAGENSVIDGVPAARDFVVRKDALPLFDFIETMAELGRVTAGPPGIPAPRVAALRQAFDAALHDPGLLADADRIRIPIHPGTGGEVEVRVRQLLDQTPETIALLRRTGATQ